jgi:glycosyltransferase involved in cell wall biosynthesis
MRKKLYLFTAGYPLDSGEQSFLREEVAFLSKFWDLTIVPTRPFDGVAEQVPDGVNVEMALASSGRWHGLSPGVMLRSFFSGLFWREIAQNRPSSFSPASFWATLVYLSKAWRVANWIESEGLNQSDPHNTLFYSWWTHWHALGVVIGRGDSKIRVVSRAHGYDLFSEQSRHGYIPFHGFILEKLDRVFSSSEAGKERLLATYPWHSRKIDVSRLGVANPMGITEGSLPEQLHLITIAYVNRVKRLEIVPKALKIFTEAHPGIQIRWTHVGDGQGLRKLIARVNQISAVSGPVTFAGRIEGRAEVLDFISQSRADLMLNTSRSEGVSIALVEGLSCGVPIMASSAGGNPELVKMSGGILLSELPSAKEIADAIHTFSEQSSTDIANMRCQAWEAWINNFLPEVVYGEFSQQLDRMIDGRAV